MLQRHLYAEIHMARDVAWLLGQLPRNSHATAYITSTSRLTDDDVTVVWSGVL